MANRRPRTKRDDATLWRELARRLDASAPTPLYHQLAMALRWEIGMGRLTFEQPLLPIRTAAAALEVNYHTVRRAYAELARLGVVNSARRRGTVVRDDQPPPAQIASASLWIAVECNLSQATQLARQVHENLGVPAVPWHLEWPEPPPGQLVTTTFHAAEVHRHWPHRAACEVPLAPHPQLPDLIQARAVALGLRQAVVIERDPGTGCALAAEFGAMLRGAGLAWRTAVASGLARLLAREPSTLLLVAPRTFDALPWCHQSHPRVLELRFAVERRAWPLLRSVLARRTGNRP